MVIRIRFIHPPPVPIKWNRNISEWSIWKHYHIIPILSFFRLFAFVCCIGYSFAVMIPATSDTYWLRYAFTSIFFQEEHESPVSNTDELSEYYESLHNYSNMIIDDFLMDVRFPNNSHPVYHNFLFSNGTSVMRYSADIDPSMLKDVVTITTSIPMFVFSTKKPITGCSRWDLVIYVSDINSNPAFFLSSKLYRSQCTKKNISTLFGKPLEYSKLPFYVATRKFSIPLFASSCFELLYILKEFYDRFKRHVYLLQNDPDYVVLSASVQVRYTISYWLPFDLVACIFQLAGSICTLMDAEVMTEIPSLNIMRIFTLGTYFMLVTTTQWFKPFKLAYHLVPMIRIGFSLFVDVVVGFFPIVSSFFLAGVFAFATVAPKTKTLLSMVEILQCFQLGDNIHPTYTEFSDGSTLFNWLSFIYITLFTITAAWVVFATFTAIIYFLHETILKNGRKKTE